MQPINWHSVFFLLFALAACVLSVAVVVSSNVVRMAIYLVGALVATGGLFFLAGADFLGVVQIMVYVGGTMVLLVFGVMLTGKGPFISMGTGGGQWILATLIGGSLLAILLPTAFGLPGPATTRERATSAEVGAAATAPTSDALGLALIGVRADKAAETGSRRDGLAGYLLPFEIVSVHLLVVLVGAAYLARARRRRQTPTSHTVASMADFKEPTA